MGGDRVRRGTAGARRASRREESRGDILRAAARLLAGRGYHGMSMRDLARATGMSLANLYNYFGSKEDLVFALQTRAFETLVGAAREALEGAGDGEARLHAFVLSHVRYVANHGDVMRVLVEEAGELPPSRRRAVRDLKERYFGLGRDIVAEVVRGRAGGARGATGEAELDRLTYGIFGMLNWVYAWYRPGRHGTPQQIARSIHRIALTGLAARSPRPAVLTETERRVAGFRVRSPILPRDAGDLA